MSSPLIPVFRFVLDASQLGAALALAGVRIGQQSPLGGLQLSAQPPLPLLQSTRLLDESGQRLMHSISEALHLAANPGRMLSCLVNTSGEPAWKEVKFFQAKEAEGPFVALDKHDDRYDFALLPGVNEAETYIGQLLGLTELSAQPDGPEVALSLAAYIALLAGADALQTTHLRVRLGRSRPAKPVLTSDLLERELGEGLSHPDTRWAVAAGRHICPVDFAGTAGRMATGLAALQSAGLVRPIQRGYGLTPPGEQVTDALANLARTAGLTLAIPGSHNRITVAQTSMFLCTQAIWIASWSDVSADDARLRLIRANASGLRAYVRGLLAPGPSGVRFCTRCGAIITDLNKKFCTGCGTQLVPSFPGPPRVVAEQRCSNPQCGRVVPADKKFCTACGTRVALEKQSG
jgi:hypothetical protein